MTAAKGRQPFCRATFRKGGRFAMSLGNVMSSPSYPSYRNQNLQFCISYPAKRRMENHIPVDMQAKGRCAVTCRMTNGRLECGIVHTWFSRFLGCFIIAARMHKCIKQACMDLDALYRQIYKPAR